MNYSEEEKEAIKRIDYIQDFIIENGQYNADVEEIKTFSVLLNLIQKQEKEIDKMAEELYFDCWDRVCQECCKECEKDKDTQRECIKEYFKKECEKDVKD